MSEVRQPLPDPELRAAFLAASYGTADRRFRLSVARPPGVPSGPAGPGECWAILTAWNPGAEQRTLAENEARQAALQEELAGERWCAGVNGEGAWAEPSVIVSGLPLRRALRLGRDFGQLALIWGCGQRAALVWCAAGRVERRWRSAL